MTMKLIRSFSLFLIFVTSLFDGSCGRKSGKGPEKYYCQCDNCISKEEFIEHKKYPTMYDFMRHMPVIGTMYTKPFTQLNSREIAGMVDALTAEAKKLNEDYESVTEENVKNIYTPAKHIFEALEKHVIRQVNKNDVRDSTVQLYEVKNSLNNKLINDSEIRDDEINFTEKTLGLIKGVYFNLDSYLFIISMKTLS
ncbi:uncharacterized protein LOC111619217 [Centruroides sculpturatus]|uniref:uncharacterized protein LOC111619217 n=1 Tax=Centruroides sculpturatus TaxID=218467 RepID=UPI000C6DB3E3|nr:uncharacterized protein LOC111619217 [Centruroides sculpturatus]